VTVPVIHPNNVDSLATLRGVDHPNNIALQTLESCWRPPSRHLEAGECLASDGATAEKGNFLFQ